MESWAVLSIYAILHFIHIVTGAVMGDVRGRSSPIVLTHAPMGPTGHLTSAPMIPTHPRIPRTAPDPPGEPAEGWKKKKLSVTEGEMSEGSLRGELKKEGINPSYVEEEKSFLWEKSSESVITGKGEDEGHKNTVESLTHSLETIETHVPTRAPFVYLPQASLPTIRPTDGIQYTPRAEVSSVTPGTLSTPANPMVTPLTPWIAGTPRTYWLESSPITPWLPATPVTQKRVELTLNSEMTATSVTQSHILPPSPMVKSKLVSTTASTRKELLRWKGENEIAPKHQLHTTLTTAHAIQVKGKLSIPSPYVPAKPTSPSASVTLREKSKSMVLQNLTKVETEPETNNSRSSISYQQGMKGQSREASEVQAQYPLGEMSKDINPQVARIWGGGDNQQLSALEEDLYRDSVSRPWLTGRRMRRKLSAETKSAPSVDGSLVTLSTESPKPIALESRKVLSADDLTSGNLYPKRVKLSDSQIKTDIELQEVRTGKQKSNVSIAERLQYEIPVKSLPERIELETNHNAQSVKTQVDFKITKTGDYGGFSVTKTEEVEPVDKVNVSKNKSNGKPISLVPKVKSITKSVIYNSEISKSVNSDIHSKQSRDIGSQGNITERVSLDKPINADTKEAIYVNTNRTLKTISSLKNIQSIAQSTVLVSSLSKGSNENKYEVGNKDSSSESRLMVSSTSKPMIKLSHNVDLKRPKDQEDSEPGKRHSSPFIINSKQLREYKATVDAHQEDSEPGKRHSSPFISKSEIKSRVIADSRRPPRLIKIPLERHSAMVMPTKIFPIAFKNGNNSTREQGSESHAATTLSSVFKEDLIPPLPYRWGEEWHAQKPENSPRKPVVLKHEGQFPESSGKESQPEESVSSTGTLKSVGGQSVTWNDVSKSNVELGATQPTKALEMDLESSMAATVPDMAGNDIATHKDSVEVREALGKADLRGSSWPGVGERVEFVTVVPGGQWDVWGGPNLWDPLAPHNNSFRNPQVYSVYWGDTGGPGSPAGWPEGVWVIRGGSLTAIVALVVTISVQVARDGPAHRGTATADSVHRAQHNQHATLATNLATSLASAHVLLIFGIQATGKAWVCGVVGLLLHFLHLVSCCWLLGLTVRLLVALHHRRPIHTAVYCTASWGASLGLVVVSYVVNPDGYETRRYCWMSVERGMLVSFIVPVCTLILVNAGVCLAAQKVLLDRRDGVKHEAMSQHKRDLRGAVSLLPLEGISWFLAVVALEDHQSLALDCAAAFVSACLGWLVLYFHGWSWRCHGLCWLRRQIASSRRVDDLSMPLTARYDHDLAHQPLIPTPTPNPPTQPHTTVTLAPPATTPTLPPQPEEFPLQPIFPAHERREAY